MIDLTKKVLPSSIHCEGKDFPVHTDFQYWIRFEEILKKTSSEEMKPEIFDYIYEDEKPHDKLLGLNELLHFYRQQTELPRPSGEASSVIYYDFRLDAEYIYAAFMEQYGIDLLETPMHWFKFLALFKGLHNTRFNEIEGYRGYMPGIKLDWKREQQKLKEAWRIEKEYTAAEQKAIDDFMNQLK